MEKMPFEGEREVVDMPDELDFWEHRWNYLGFIVRGVLINDSDRAIRVVLGGPRFIEGRTPLSERPVRKPIKTDPSWGMYLIEARGLALFQWDADSTVDNWIDRSNNAEGAIPVAASFTCFPGSYDDITTRVAIEITSDIVGPAWNKKDKWLVGRGQPVVTINYERNYKTDVKRLREELTKKYELW